MAHTKPDVPQFNHAQYYAYGSIFLIYTAAEYVQEWKGLRYFFHPSLEPNTFLYILRLVLFATIILLTIRWIIATTNELDMWSSSPLDWSHWINSPFSKQNAYSAIYGLALILGLLLASVQYILIIASIFSCYFLFGYWTQQLCNNHFRRALKDTKVDSPVQKKKLAIMKRYWLKRPQLERVVLMMFLSLISLSFATAAFFQSKYKIIYEEVSYFILILDIITGEIVISFWRYKRDSDLEETARY